ncbi:FecR domain-containing protein [Parabacteroides gordonii]|jgi:transmembrane sensor|uniref:FecR family protein n=1 Tax=Parabacteroides gordonii TaxID=574930 RepID=UPI00241EF230|nr:FecR domain-containing protein [Parabacteroides gordonii]
MEEQRKHIEEPETSLLLLYIGGKASAEECAIVESWLHDKEENEQTLLQIARIYHVQYTHRRIEQRDPLKAFEKVQERVRQRVWKKNIYRFSTVAACLVVGFFLSTLLSWWNTTDSEVKAQMVTVRSNPGMRTSCNLPDGTVAYLNSGSTLIYPVPYDNDKRTVTLDGEGYFKVIHDPEKPFIVNVADGKMRVKVLGTEFNLQAYLGEGQIETTLVSGKVNIETEKENGTVVRQELSPSMKATYILSTGKMNMEIVNPVYETAWIEGKLMFYNSPLPEVLRDLSYFYNVKFEVKDPLIKSYYFTGTFIDKQLSQILDYLQISSGIDYKIRQITGDDSKGINYTVVELTNKRK